MTNSPMPPIPAATVVLIRDHLDQLEVLLVQKHEKITFGGMWVFPGGKIDADDYDQHPSLEIAARVAAVRELSEEVGVRRTVDQLKLLSEWTPPPSDRKRYQTLFFLCAAQDDQAIEIDGEEIVNAQWAAPADLIQQHASGEIELTPPTWLTLHHLIAHAKSAEAMAAVEGQDIPFYCSHVVKTGKGQGVVLWEGDAGYEEYDPELPGTRHRLVMRKEGSAKHYVFEDSRLSL